MTPEELSELSRFPAFPEMARTLIRVAGIEAAAKLITCWPGQEPPMPTARSVNSGRARVQFERIVSVIGEETAWKLIHHFGGDELQIPSCKGVMYQYLQEIIRAKFDRMTTAEGMSFSDTVFELGIEYNLNRRTVERILKRPGTGVAVMATPEKKRMTDRQARAKFDDQQGFLF